MFDFVELVDHHPHRHAADLLGAGADRVQTEPARVFPCDEQNDLAGALVVPGAAGVGQIGSEVDQVLAQGFERLRMGRLHSGPEHDRHAGRIPFGNRVAARQKHHDAEIGRMLDRDSREAGGELTSNAVGRSNARFLRLQPPQRFVGRNRELRGILSCVVRQRLRLGLDGLR